MEDTIIDLFYNNSSNDERIIIIKLKKKKKSNSIRKVRLNNGLNSNSNKIVKKIKATIKEIKPLPVNLNNVTNKSDIE